MAPTAKCPRCGDRLQPGVDPSAKWMHCPSCQASFAVPVVAPAGAVSAARLPLPVRYAQGATTAADCVPPSAAPRRALWATLVPVLVGAFLLGSCCLGAVVLGSFTAMPDAALSQDAAVIDRDVPALPPRPGPPIRVRFDPSGAFTAQATLDPDDADPRAPLQRCRRFLLDTRAGVPYVVELLDPRGLRLRAEPVGGGLAIEPTDDAGPHAQIALLPTQPGAYVVLVTGPPDASDRTFTLRVRIWDEAEPLPEHLKFPATQRLPGVEVAQQVKDRRFVSGAFAPDGKTFWVVHDDMTLTLWQYPGPTKKGTYQLKTRLHALAIDRRGRLYAQPGPPGKNLLLAGGRPVGDLDVYERLDPRGDADLMPPPARNILLRGLVGRLIPSADGRRIFFLDVHNRKVGRIDTEAGAVDRTVDDLAPGTCAFCLTADGTKIYTCSDRGRIDVIHVGLFQRERSITLRAGKPHEIAASDRGMVFLLGQELAAAPGNCAVVDLTRDTPGPVSPMPVACSHHGQYLQMSPDQRAVFIAGDRRVSVCAVPTRPALTRLTCRAYPIGDAFAPGWIQLSPDGRTLLHDAGAILSIGQ